MVFGGDHVRVPGGLHALLRRGPGHDVPEDPQLAPVPRDPGGDGRERVGTMHAVRRAPIIIMLNCFRGYSCSCAPSLAFLSYRLVVLSFVLGFFSALCLVAYPWLFVHPVSFGFGHFLKPTGTPFVATLVCCRVLSGRFLTSLISAAPDRLGKNGVEEVMSSTWLAGVPWERIREVRAPYVTEGAARVKVRTFRKGN